VNGDGCGVAYPDAVASLGPPRAQRGNDPYAVRPTTQVGQRARDDYLEAASSVASSASSLRLHGRTPRTCASSCWSISGAVGDPHGDAARKTQKTQRRRPFQRVFEGQCLSRSDSRARGDAGVRRSVPAASSASSRSSSRATRRPGASRRLCARDRRLSGCPTRSASVSLALEDARQDAEDAAGGRASLFVVIYSGLSPASCVPGRARPR